MDLREIDRAGTARHPWESARLSFVLDKLTRLPRGGGTRVLDVGCGDGYVARAVQNALPHRQVVAVDTELAQPSPSAPGRRPEGLTFVNRWEDVPDDTFDLALMLDVIEHVPDDLAFVRQVATKLTPAAHALVTVPAYAALFGAHDRFLGHYRRYGRSQLTALLGTAGLQVAESGYLFFSPLVARCAALAREKTLGASAEPTGVGRWRRGPRVTRLVHQYLRLENSLMDLAQSRRLRFPGLSAWALCRR